MADYKSCAWYQKGMCIRDDKSGAPISCTDCEDYERRVIFKIEDLQERNEEMSVRKSCANCKHNKIGICHFGYVVGGRACNTTAMEYWELSDDAKADVLHDAAPEHDIPKYKSCKRYINGSCANARIFADKPNVNFDCSKCKSYRYYKLPTNTPTNTPTKSPTEPEHDAVNHPKHYCKGGMECADAMKACVTGLSEWEAVCTSHAFKYLWRWKDKDGSKDIRKCIRWLEMLLREVEKDE